MCEPVHSWRKKNCKEIDDVQSPPQEAKNDPQLDPLRPPQGRGSRRNARVRLRTRGLKAYCRPGSQ